MRPITPNDKKQIYHYLASSFMNLVMEGKIGRFERKVIAQRVLKGMGSAATFNDVISLVDGLAKTYPFFIPAATQIKAQLSSFHEQKVIANLEHYITNFSQHA